MGVTLFLKFANTCKYLSLFLELTYHYGGITSNEVFKFLVSLSDIWDLEPRVVFCLSLLKPTTTTSSILHLLQPHSTLHLTSEVCQRNCQVSSGLSSWRYLSPESRHLGGRSVESTCSKLTNI